MKNLLVLTLMLFVILGFSQSEISIGIGTHNIGVLPSMKIQHEFDDVIYQGYPLVFNISYRYKLSKNISLGANMNTTNFLQSWEDKSLESGILIITSIKELSTHLEYYPIKKHKFGLYTFTGLGITYINQHIYAYGENNTRPLIWFNYDRETLINGLRLIIPIGLGIKHKITKTLYLGLEYNYKFLFSKLAISKYTPRYENRYWRVSFSNKVSGTNYSFLLIKLTQIF